VRLELGPREVAEGKVMMVDRLSGKKEAMPIDRFVAEAEAILADAHARMLERALQFRRENTFEVDDYAEFQKRIEEQGGFFEMHWCGSPRCEEKIKEETKATIRCISLEDKRQEGKCVYCQAPSERRVIFARAY
jgi:prolyl-tRNA synthetase